MKNYAGRRVFVTGGLGFIGSNLTIRLVQLGARVTVVDSLVAGCGGNRRNLRPVANDVEVIEADAGAVELLRPYLRRAETIFNLAGEVSHSHSMEFPERDLEINVCSQMAFVRECAAQAPGVRIVYAGTRQVYGRPQYLPVDENHPLAPVDFNGIHKLAASQYHLVLSDAGQLDAVVLRLTNVYGPRLALNIPCQGVLAVFFARVLLGERAEVFGDGTQLRDPVYVDDAVDALLRAGSVAKPASRTYNVGGPRALSLKAIANTISEAGGALPPLFRPFPYELSQIDIGSFYANCERIGRELGWQPAVQLEDGVARTFDFFRRHLRDYLKPGCGYPQCELRPSLRVQDRTEATA